MTDLVIGVKIRADGSGLIGQTRLSKAATDELTTAAKGLGTELGKTSAKQDEATAAIGRGAKAAREAAVAQESAAVATKKHGEGLGTTGIAAAEAGHSVRAFFDSVNAGQSPIRAFTLELPRLTQAAGFMGGALGAVGEFLAGPWGIAVLLGVSVLGPLIGSLFETKSNADQAKESIDTISDAIKAMGAAIDQTNGKLDSYNAKLAQAAALRAAASRPELAKTIQSTSDDIFSEAKSARTKFGAKFIGYGLATAGLAGDGNYTAYNQVDQALASANGNAAALTATIVRLAQTNPALQPLAKSLSEQNETLAKSRQTYDEAGVAINRYTVLSQGGVVQTKETVENEIARATATDKSARATQALTEARQQLTKAEQTYDREGPTADATSGLNKAKEQVIQAQKALDAVNSASKAKKPKADTKTSTEGEEIKRINEEFDRTPTLVDKAAQATRKLDAIIADLTKRKPPGFEKLIADAQAAKQVVVDGIQKPYLDYIEEQQHGLQVQQLIVAGRQDEADALKVILALEKERGPLLPEQKAAILATVEAVRAEQHELDVLHEKAQAYTAALGSVKTAVLAVFQDPMQGLEKLPGRILSAFKELSAQTLFEKLFGDAFRELQAQVDGTSTVRDASQRMSEAVDKASAAIGRLGSAADGAAGKVSGQPVPGASTGATPTPSTDAASALGDIIVRGNPLRQPSAFFANAISKLAKGVGISDEAADKIGKVSGKVIAGAATGTVAASVASSLFGIGGNSAGNQVGGAIGGAIGKIGGEALGKTLGSSLGKLASFAGPIGSVVGGVLGSVLGGLFTKSPGGGGTTITSATGAGTASGTNATFQSNSSGAASSVQSAIAQIAQQLGGAVSGWQPVTIGQYGKDSEWRVNTTGGSTLGGSSSAIAGVDYFSSGDAGQAAAIADAIRIQISSGVVTGLSAAVTKALSSSTDVNAALQEALNVQKVEALIGGLGYTLSKTFSTFDGQAKQSYDLAVKYGLDTVAVEKANAAARVKLIADSLKDEVGPLQDLLTSLDSGDLFQGSATDKRNALLSQITDARTKADTGEDGAADTLSSLLQQLISNDQANFGTAGGEYTMDLTLARDAANEAVSAAQSRIDQAASASQDQADALAKANDLADESNDLLSAINAKLGAQSSTLSAILAAYGGGGSGIDLSSVLRTAAAV